MSLRPILHVQESSMRTLIRPNMGLLSGEVISAMYRIVERRAFINRSKFSMLTHDAIMHVRIFHESNDMQKFLDVKYDRSFLTYFTLTPVLLRDEEPFGMWTLVVTVPSIKKIFIYDPCHVSRKEVGQTIFNFYKKITVFRGIRPDFDGWEIVDKFTSPCRIVPADSGILICYYAEQLYRYGDVRPKPVDTCELRKKYASRIRKASVLGRTDPLGCYEPHPLEMPPSRLLWIDERHGVPPHYPMQLQHAWKLYWRSVEDQENNFSDEDDTDSDVSWQYSKVQLNTTS